MPSQKRKTSRSRSPNRSTKRHAKFQRAKSPKSPKYVNSPLSPFSQFSPTSPNIVMPQHLEAANANPMERNAIETQQFGQRLGRRTRRRERRFGRRIARRLARNGNVAI